MSTTTTPTAPARDGRCFVETPLSVAVAIRRYLLADAAWGAGLRREDYTFAESSVLYEAAQGAERELVRVMEEAQGEHARLAGYYECDGWFIGFDRIHSDGMALTIKRTKPVFAAKRPR